MDLDTILKNRDVIKAWPAEKQNVFLGMAFDNFVRPKLKLPDDAVPTARQKWMDSFVGRPSAPFPEDFARPSKASQMPPYSEGLKQEGKLAGGAAATFLSGAGKGLEKTVALPRKLGLPGGESPLERYFRGESEYFGGLAQPFVKEHPIVGALTSGAGQFVPGGALAEVIGGPSTAAGLGTKALGVLSKAGAEAVPFSDNLSDLAKQTALFSAGNIALGGIGRGLGKLAEKVLPSKAAASEASVAATPTPAAVTPPVVAPQVPEAAEAAAKVSDSEALKHKVLDSLKAPAGDLKAREDWLYTKAPPGTPDAYNTQYADLKKTVAKTPAPLKEAVKQSSIPEAKRLADEAHNLVKLRKKAGEAVVKLSTEEVEQLRQGKTAEEIFNPAVQPAVVAEQPQMKAVAEMAKEVQAKEAPASAVEGAKEAPTPAPAKPEKAPKEIKVPELGDKLLMSRYALSLKAGKSVAEVSTLLRDDAKKLATQVMAGADTEAVKFGKLQKINADIQRLLYKINAGEVGKTSGLSKVAKQTAERPTTFGEESVGAAKDAERLAASPTQSFKEKESQFFELYGRAPQEHEQLKIDAGVPPAEAVDADFQMKFEEDLDQKELMH